MYYKRFDNFSFNRKVLQSIYFDQVHPFVISNPDDPDAKRFNHMSSPAFSMDYIKSIDADLFDKIKKFFDTISKKYNVSNGFIGRFFTVGPNLKAGVHVDSFLETRIVREWALNFPVYNTDNNYQEWVTVNDMSQPIYTHRGILYETENIDVIEKIILDVPHLLKVSNPHRIVNNTNDFRVVFSIRGKSNDTSYEQVEKIF